MINKISLIAIKQDLQKLRRKFLAKANFGWFFLIPFIYGVDDFLRIIENIPYFNFMVIAVHIIVGTFLFRRYRRENQKIKNLQTIRIESKEKNRRAMYWLLSFVLGAIVVSMILSGGFLTIIGNLFALGTIIFLMNAIFYLPPVLFEADGYNLEIQKGNKKKYYLDFTFMKAIEFTPDSIVFYDNNRKKTTLKDVNIDRESILMVKHFLEDNYGEEQLKYISNATARYYSITK